MFPKRDTISGFWFLLQFIATVSFGFLQTKGKDLLVVLSDSGKLSFLAFCTEMHRL